ncbi:uncharacterized protein LOC127802189 [Diospyros lotus]|uniref:uncharacterized protein LOC127802189 n=1 Tax=Diospyros lotus TaxID=55363 RepID=UPI00224FC055|nr:uncharacterized protein LOC127802189 [Diospyros lotus]
MSFPDAEYFFRYQNRLIQDELQYNRHALSQEHIKLVSNLNDEQRYVYDIVMDAVKLNGGGMFFVYGYGGTGKTFVWKTLSTTLRSKGEIVLNVTLSGITYLFLPGGRTAYSKFVIPLNSNEDSTCNIKQGSPLAELIIRSNLIIWDEAHIMNKYCLEALDRSM